VFHPTLYEGPGAPPFMRRRGQRIRAGHSAMREQEEVAAGGGGRAHQSLHPALGRSCAAVSDGMPERQNRRAQSLVPQEPRRHSGAELGAVCRALARSTPDKPLEHTRSCKRSARRHSGQGLMCRGKSISCLRELQAAPRPGARRHAQQPSLRVLLGMQSSLGTGLSGRVDEGDGRPWRLQRAACVLDLFPRSERR
jgi:hypothetical protein